VLYLNGGEWGGRQIVPSEWVEASTSPQADPYYGYWWWVEPGGFYIARGNHGQNIFVDPSRGLVMARFGTTDGDADWPSVFADLATRLGP
jgi:CubicO group peptidase (beta-lactamase class C family)